MPFSTSIRWAQRVTRAGQRILKLLVSSPVVRESLLLRLPACRWLSFALFSGVATAWLLVPTPSAWLRLPAGGGRQAGTRKPERRLAGVRGVARPFAPRPGRRRVLGWL